MDKKYTGILEDRSGGFSGQWLELQDGQTVWLGSDPKNDVILTENNIAPFHCGISYDAAKGCFWVINEAGYGVSCPGKGALPQGEEVCLYPKEGLQIGSCLFGLEEETQDEAPEYDRVSEFDEVSEYNRASEFDGSSNFDDEEYFSEAKKTGGERTLGRLGSGLLKRIKAVGITSKQMKTGAIIAAVLLVAGIAMAGVLGRSRAANQQAAGSGTGTVSQDASAALDTVPSSESTNTITTPSNTAPSESTVLETVQQQPISTDPAGFQTDTSSGFYEAKEVAQINGKLFFWDAGIETAYCTLDPTNQGYMTPVIYDHDSCVSGFIVTVQYLYLITHDSDENYGLLQYNSNFERVGSIQGFSNVDAISDGYVYYRNHSQSELYRAKLAPGSGSTPELLLSDYSRDTALDWFQIDQGKLYYWNQNDQLMRINVDGSGSEDLGITYYDHLNLIGIHDGKIYQMKINSVLPADNNNPGFITVMDAGTPQTEKTLVENISSEGDAVGYIISNKIIFTRNRLHDGEGYRQDLWSFDLDKQYEFCLMEDSEEGKELVPVNVSRQTRLYYTAAIGDAYTGYTLGLYSIELDGTDKQLYTDFASFFTFYHDWL